MTSGGDEKSQHGFAKSRNTTGTHGCVFKRIHSNRGDAYGGHQSIFYNLKNALFSFAYFTQSSQIASLDL